MTRRSGRLSGRAEGRPSTVRRARCHGGIQLQTGASGMGAVGHASCWGPPPTAFAARQPLQARMPGLFIRDPAASGISGESGAGPQLLASQPGHGHHPRAAPLTPRPRRRRAPCRQDEPQGWDTAAIADVSPTYYGACGRCLEVRCSPGAFTDGYGEVLQRGSACRDPGASVVSVRASSRQLQLCVGERGREREPAAAAAAAASTPPCPARWQPRERLAARSPTLSAAPVAGCAHH